MQNIRLVIAYDGTYFYGWQETLSGPSIAQTVREILEQILQEKITLEAASRTDRGVHALGQVAHFFTSKESIDLKKLLESLNALLPKAIRILSLDAVPLSFHPTLDAIGKVYTYDICYGPLQYPSYRFTSWHVQGDLNLETVDQASAFLRGNHDFSSFCNQRKNLNYPDKQRHVFDIKRFDLGSYRLRFELSGNHFLYKMVRNLVGTLMDIGKGKLKLEDLPSILESKKRAEAGLTAPAHGLTLKEILYPPRV